MGTGWPEELYDIDAWLGADVGRRAEVLARIVDVAAGALALTDDDGAMPCVVDVATGLRLCLVPGGTFWMGLGDHELAIFEDAPFRDALAGQEALAAGLDGHLVELAERAPPELVTVAPFLLAADAWPDLHDAHPRLRLPSEAEWERALRAGSTTPFWWGDAPAPSGPHPLGLRDLGLQAERVDAPSGWAVARGGPPLDVGGLPLHLLSAFRAAAPEDAWLRPVFELGLPRPDTIVPPASAAPRWTRSSYVEDLLAALADASPARRRAAREALRVEVGGYGRFGGQAVAAIGPLLERALAGAPEAAELLALAVDLIAGDHRGVVGTGLDPAHPGLAARLGRAPARALHAALRSVAPRIVKLLSYDDPALRAVAALALGVGRVDTARGAIQRALPGEADHDAAASLLLALGHLAPRAPSVAALVPPEVSHRLIDPSPVVAGAAALARVMLGVSFDPRAAERVRELARAGPRPTQPWHGGDLARLAAKIVAERVPDGALLMAGLLVDLAATDDPRAADWALGAARLGLAFGPEGPSPRQARLRDRIAALPLGVRPQALLASLHGTVSRDAASLSGSDSRDGDAVGGRVSSP